MDSNPKKGENFKYNNQPQLGKNRGTIPSKSVNYVGGVGQNVKIMGYQLRLINGWLIDWLIGWFIAWLVRCVFCLACLVEK